LLTSFGLGEGEEERNRDEGVCFLLEDCWIWPNMLSWTGDRI
jgi:hypothetical protein